eukprot:Selendium_serpulae@DN4752_c0_g1_i1.p1
MGKKKDKKAAEGAEEPKRDVVDLSKLPEQAGCPTIFAVAHIFASFNDTFIHVTDLSCRETLVRVTGGMKVKNDRDESSAYAAQMAASDVAARLKELGISHIHIKLRGVGGLGTKALGPGAQTAIRSLARSQHLKIGRIEDATPIPHDSCRKRHGRRGRRL